MNKPLHNYGSISSTSQDVLFSGDRSVEFNAACDSVVTNIYTINSSFKVLDTALKNIGTKKDNHGLRNKVHVTQLSTNDIAAVTSKEIRKLKSLMKKGNKQQQLQVEKLEENFKEAIGRYSVVQKGIATKQKAHLLVSVNIENELQNENSSSQQETQRLLARELAFEQEMLMERETRIRQIESDVLNVNEIMRELGTLVHDQAEVIDTIENSIDHAVGNVEEGTEQLLKAAEYQKKRRWKLFWLVLILLIIAAFLIIIIVFSMKK
ncbi:syntaxin-12 [Harmonia axyridis]|uniref:syntaxin-12 n=1 Tax=Harmonia axyridis TaxID=115357 RepID=UPI001E27876A|nr:syntaxin-12 [Harmonia axyridis]XP_045479584.1 syntaxin-12 [Harmonia axyridis]